MKGSDNAVYADASEILLNYYRSGKHEASITYAIQGLRFDPYFRIIQLYFEEGKTIEQIAEVLGVDVSTVMRNKKRLCLIIYNEIV
jgi:DNA-binding NarL/FixJ family response regulator